MARQLSLHQDAYHVLWKHGRFLSRAGNDDHGSPRAMLDELFGIRQPLGTPELQHGEMVLHQEALRHSPLNKLLSDLATIPVASGSSGMDDRILWRYFSLYVCCGAISGRIVE